MFRTRSRQQWLTAIATLRARFLRAHRVRPFDLDQALEAAPIVAALVRDTVDDVAVYRLAREAGTLTRAGQDKLLALLVEQCAEQWRSERGVQS